MVARITESDVENNIVWPLLTGAEYLSIPRGYITSTKYIPAKDIGKGASFVRGFAPDFLVYANRSPLFVIEAKAPDEPAELAYAQSRLYAAEINSGYRTGLNPIKWLLGTNGTTGPFGPADAQPTVVWHLPAGLQPGPEAIEIVRAAGWPALEELSLAFFNLLQRERFFTGVHTLGGQAKLNQRLGQNSLSDLLAPIIRRYFDTESPEAKEEILEKAYVDSDLTTRYARVFEDFLREKSIPVAAPVVKTVAPHRRNERHLTDALDSYAATLPSTGSIQLLIGAVGAGKSMFIERFEKYLLPDSLRRRTFWVYANFNEARPSPAEYEGWLCEQFVAEFKRIYYTNDPTIQLAVFADRKREFDFTNYLIKETDIHEYNRRLSIELSDWSRDARSFALSAARYLVGDQRIGIVCVLDNTDRGTREQQLRLFEVAEWFKTDTRSCCVVALRDDTYERYKSEPPLDAFIHANHFYIRVPRFIDIVRKRIQLCLAEMPEWSVRASVSGLGTVTISSDRAIAFLDAVYRQLFQYSDRKISWITEGLAGRDARSALRMFARLIYSPHFDERHFIRAGAATGSFTIPERSILNALMKTDFLYFSDDHGFVKNILDFCDGTTTSDNFHRTEILAFLVAKRKERGDVGIEGYFAVATLCERMNVMGYEPRDTVQEIDWCVRNGLVVADQFGDRPVIETDIVRAHASAFVHTKLLMGRLDYLANCALTTKLFDRGLAERVGEVWRNALQHHDISRERKCEITQALRDYIVFWGHRREALFPVTSEIGEAVKIIVEGTDRALRGPLPPRSSPQQGSRRSGRRGRH